MYSTRDGSASAGRRNPVPTLEWFARFSLAVAPRVNMMPIRKVSARYSIVVPIRVCRERGNVAVQWVLDVGGKESVPGGEWLRVT